MPEVPFERAGEKALVTLFNERFGGHGFPAILISRAGLCLAQNAAFERLEGDGSIRPGRELLGALDEAQHAYLKDVLGSGRCDPVSPTVIRWAQAGLMPIDLHLMNFDCVQADGTVSNGFLAHAVVQEERRVGRQIPSLRLTSDQETEAERIMRTSLEVNNLALWSHCPATGEAWHSDVWYRQLGYEVGAFDPGLQNWIDLMHPDDREAALAAFAALVEGRTDLYQADFRLRHKDGWWLWIGAQGARVDRSEIGLPFVVCGIQADIMERKLAHDQIEEAARVATLHRERLDRLADNAPVGLFEFRMSAEGLVSLPYIAQSVLETLGVSRGEVASDGSVVFRNVLPDYMPDMMAAIEASREALSNFQFRCEVEHPQQGRIWINIKSHPVRLEDGATTWFGSLYDVTPEVQREADLQAARDHAMEMTRQMELLAMHDALTGLANRRKFDQALSERHDRPAGERMTLIRVDLDHFKYVNDNLGHDAGDAVLCHVARTLSECVRGRDEVFRLGGDEFSILLSADGSIQTAQEIVARVQQALTIPFLFEGQVCRFGASFGIAVANSGEISDAELNTFADVALYEAKALGRNRVEVFTDKLHRHIIENRHLAVELEEALERKEFMPYFQPQICARTGALVGMETLARWQHPTRGVVGPDHFLAVADQIHIVPMIDQMIFGKTREVLRDWRGRGFHPKKISFNVSSGRMQNHTILDGAKALLSDGVRVGFELLESILVEDETEAFRHQLDALRDLGIQIEIDDFGSGHASIVGLMECDPAVLKIDRRLVQHIEDNPQGQHLITAVIGMARALGISVTVEGVETLEQAEILRGLGCDVFQGFLFSRPLAPEAMFAFAKALRSSAA